MENQNGAEVKAVVVGVELTDDQKCHPFSNGAQFADWTMQCQDCQKREKCEILKALVQAYWGDGTVSRDIAKRMGFFEHRKELVWRCNEYVE